MARRVSALVTVTAASSGSCPLVGVRIVHRRRLLSTASIIYKLFVQYIRALISITTYATGNAMIPCSSGKMSILEQEAD